ncbi:MAG: zinc ribbon domain-containing protein [Oculatellaceae cyanobacterium bins.114]|nr:zinc ribbon domain-containing protein [Oculatellaceae cyanobacterium bins.114]
MAYICNLGSGQLPLEGNGFASLYIDQQGTQTRLTLNSSRLGQQQSQSLSVATGNWTVPPTLFQTSMGLILRIESGQGQTFITIQAGQLQVLTTPPSLANAKVLPLQQSEATPISSMSPMQPMQPMQPMRMGDMEMQMSPMQMRMGNMELKMGDGKPAQSATGNRFCPQCGGAIKEGDYPTGGTASHRFCSNCGQALT